MFPSNKERDKSYDEECDATSASNLDVQMECLSMESDDGEEEEMKMEFDEEIFSLNHGLLTKDPSIRDAFRHVFDDIELEESKLPIVGDRKPFSVMDWLEEDENMPKYNEDDGRQNDIGHGDDWKKNLAIMDENEADSSMRDVRCSTNTAKSVGPRKARKRLRDLMLIPEISKKKEEVEATRAPAVNQLTNGIDCMKPTAITSPSANIMERIIAVSAAFDCSLNNISLPTARVPRRYGDVLMKFMMNCGTDSQQLRMKVRIAQPAHRTLKEAGRSFSDVVAYMVWNERNGMHPLSIKIAMNGFVPKPRNEDDPVFCLEEPLDGCKLLEYIESLRTMTLSELSDFMLSVELFVDSEIGLRKMSSYMKLTIANGNIDRAMMRENNTIRTSVKNRIKFLSLFINFEELGGTQDSLWTLIIPYLDDRERRLHGQIPAIEKEAMDALDISFLIRRHGSATRDPRLVQAWATALFLSCGYRPGSIDVDPSGTFMKRALIGKKRAEDEMANVEPGKRRSVEISYFFQGLKCGDVTVFRCRPQEGDPKGGCRYNIKVSIHKMKIGGYTEFVDKGMHLKYPSSDGNWSACPAIGILILCMIVGYVKREDVEATNEDFFGRFPSEEKVDISDAQRKALANSPIILAHGRGPQLNMGKAGTVANAYQPMIEYADLPPSLFSPRSLRKGYAGQGIQQLAQSRHPSSVISLDEVTQVLTTSVHWRSSQQSSRYIRGILQSMQDDVYADMSLTAKNWANAIVRSSVRARFVSGGYSPASSKDIITHYYKHGEVLKADNKQTIIRRNQQNAARYLSAEPEYDCSNVPEECKRDPIDIPLLSSSLSLLLESAHGSFPIRRNTRNFSAIYLRRPTFQFRYVNDFAKAKFEKFVSHDKLLSESASTNDLYSI